MQYVSDTFMVLRKSNMFQIYSWYWEKQNKTIVLLNRFHWNEIELTDDEMYDLVDSVLNVAVTKKFHRNENWPTDDEV